LLLALLLDDTSVLLLQLMKLVDSDRSLAHPLVLYLGRRQGIPMAKLVVSRIK
jgi:hypothetical protein